MVLFTGIAAHGIDHEVRVDVISVRVGCNHNLEAGELLCQLQGNLVRHLRGDRIVGMEGLHHMVVHPPAGAAVLTLGVHEFQQSNIRYAVDAGDQGAALIGSLVGLAAVVDDAVETADCLRPLAFHKVNDGHSCHRLVLRMSDSKKLTCAYASASSLRYTVFTLPIFARVVS